MRYWQRFLDWITHRRISNLVISAVGEIRGPVRYVHRMRDQFVVMTDRDVYVVYEDEMSQWRARRSR